MHVIGHDFDGPNFQHLFVDTYVYLAPFGAALCPATHTWMFKGSAYGHTILSTFEQILLLSIAQQWSACNLWVVLRGFTSQCRQDMAWIHIHRLLAVIKGAKSNAVRSSLTDRGKFCKKPVVCRNSSLISSFKMRRFWSATSLKLCRVRTWQSALMPRPSQKKID